MAHEWSEAVAILDTIVNGLQDTEWTHIDRKQEKEAWTAHYKQLDRLQEEEHDKHIAKKLKTQYAEIIRERA